MEKSISARDKFDVQQNYRRYLKYQEQYERMYEQLKTAKASRVWVAGIVALLFAVLSEFFLGAAAALFGLYFYRIAMTWNKSFQADEGREEVLRWFSSKGLKFEGRILYFRDDQMLEKPLDPFAEESYQ